MSTSIAGLSAGQKRAVRNLRAKSTTAKSEDRIAKLISKWQTRAEAVALNKLASVDPKEFRARQATKAASKLDEFIAEKSAQATQSPSEFYRRISSFESNLHGAAKAKRIRQQPKTLRTNPELLTKIVYVAPVKVVG